MSRDAKNSILLWIGTLAFVGLFWAGLHFEIGTRIPDRWWWPMIGIVTGVNLLKFLCDFVRKRKADGL